ncbi:response regulator transcription factor [Agarilytica rhodophyticola]|uniref:response regulator transcription factor n=1 Tax=Agarilytica rhodophyticola TaxID=1737490 RepID=UPI000CD8654C|nr:response regulator transcription factor [Agarilytica rhodophyticola]
MANILIVEDEKKLADFLHRGLEGEGYCCDWVATVDELLSRLNGDTYDLILLDRMLGDADTIDYLTHIRQKQPQVMILVLTALHEIEDKVEGLHAGADDYLGKPFDFDELLARILALLRRTKNFIKDDSEILEQGVLQINIESQRILLNKSQVGLTQLEFRLLKLFLSNPEKVLTRERILSKIWGTNSDPMTNIVDVYIRRLRKKLSESAALPQDSGEIFIETVRGAGYRLGSCNLQ